MDPRPVFPGQVLFFSRRCTQRQFLLRPDDVVTQIVLYCLGEAAQRFSVTIYAWIVMCNHYHLLARDNLGNYPDFLAHFHKMVAKAMNAYLGRKENFWAAEQPSVIRPITAADEARELFYLLTNPVLGDLVDRVADWPGSSSLETMLTGRPLRVERPEVFFSKHGVMPDEVTLETARLDQFAGLSDDEWRTFLADEVTAAEKRERARRLDQKKTVLGRKRVLCTPRTDTPRRRVERREARLAIACMDEARRDYELELLKEFRFAHRDALDQWRTGARDTLFPPGTFRMRWFGARVAEEALAA